MAAEFRCVSPVVVGDQLNSSPWHHQVYIAFDPSTQSVVVAHEGTDPTELYVYSTFPIARCICMNDHSSLSVLNSIQFVLEPLDASAIPDAPSSLHCLHIFAFHSTFRY